MKNYNFIYDSKGNIEKIETSLKGSELLRSPILNKGTAFTIEERKAFDLEGLLPFRVETLEEQSARHYEQFKKLPTMLAKNIYLNELRTYNETLFFKLANDHIKEMLPIIYTPVIGEAIENFSAEFRTPRGLFISYKDKDRLDQILANYKNDDVSIIVVTDGERILGIGDQGTGGVYISVGKLAVYTLCSNLNPHRLLPIQLDVGTNSEKLLNDPFYLGIKEKRITDKEYDDFIGAFVAAVYRRFPKVFLHWEDFGYNTARKNLERYQNKICTFNDDMQGTGAVVLACLISSMSILKAKMKDQTVVFLGAGTSATGIADQIRDAMIRDGASSENACQQIYLLNSSGLVTDDSSRLTKFQLPYAKNKNQIKDWQIADKNKITLLDVVKNTKPTILIGVSTVPNSFTEEIVKEMAKYTARPIIFPLSNPTSKCEAIPADLINWTDGKAIVATGSPFADVNYKGKNYQIAQCNNAFVFPGLGLGIVAVKAKRVTDTMIWAGCKALADLAPAHTSEAGSLLPDLKNIKEVSRVVAKAVAMQAIKEGWADNCDVDVAINKAVWLPKYYNYQ